MPEGMMRKTLIGAAFLGLASVLAAADEAAAIAARAWYHVDATRAASLMTVVQNGTNFVTRWSDVRPGVARAAVPSKVTKAQGGYTRVPRLPYLGRTEEGRPYVDFGSFLTETDGHGSYLTNGWGAALIWNAPCRNVREAFLVIADTPDVAEVANGKTRAPFVLGHSTDYGFHRGNTGLFEIGNAAPGVKKGRYLLDGREVKADETIGDEFRLLELQLAEGVPADAFAQDRHIRFGGQRISEALIFDVPLKDAERDALRRHLEEKWFGKDGFAKRAAARRTGERERLAAALYDPEALLRAVKGYAARHPGLFPDAAELEAEIRRLGKRRDARKICALMENVLFRLPELADFEDVVCVKRGGRDSDGFPNNWQGNTSVPVSGYDNAIVRMPWRPHDSAAERELYFSDAFLGDLALDFEAEKVAFSTRKLSLPPGITNLNQGGWCVAEMPLGRPGLVTEISPTDLKDVDFFEPMYLPDGKMFMVGTVGFQGVPCMGGQNYVANLLLRHEDGRLRRLTYDQDNNWNPVMLPNGRCLYLRWEYADIAHYFSRVLMTMNPDGSDQQEFYGSNSVWPTSLFFTKPVPGSSTKFTGIVSGHHGIRRKGRLFLFDVAKGRREAEGVVQELPGWGKPIVTETKDYLVDGLKRYFLHPVPLSEELVLVSAQDLRLSPRFFLALVDVYDNVYPLAAEGEGGRHFYHALPVKKTPLPLSLASRVDETKTNALVNIVDVYRGPGLANVPRGTVKKLRVYCFEYSYRHLGGHTITGLEGPWDPRVLLGEVPVEEDGSAFFEVPANRPIAVQPLDEEGMHLQEMRSWFAAMPGETLSCLGCHEKQDVAPGMASRKPPAKIAPWYGRARNFAFEREVLNVVERRCSGCHDGASAKKDPTGRPLPCFKGRAWDVYYNLMPYVRRMGVESQSHIQLPLEFHPRTSELTARLEMGHHGVRLTPEEKDRLVTWIDLDVPFHGSWKEMARGNRRVLGYIQRRRELERRVANLQSDPDEVVYPYKPVAFEPPAAELRAADEAAEARRHVRAPVEISAARREDLVLDLGEGVKLALKYVPALGGFYLGETEVSQRQYQRFDPSHDNGYYDKHGKNHLNRGYCMGYDREFAPQGHPDYPAVRVDFNRANDFCSWLSEKSGRKVRLPTAEEWDAAAWAGATTILPWGGYDVDWSGYANLAGTNRWMLCQYADDNKYPDYRPEFHCRWGNYSSLWRKGYSLDFVLRDDRFCDGALHLADVGSFRPNAWGLKDMIGNAAEWTATETAAGRRVVRGGSFDDRPHAALLPRSYPPWQRVWNTGFRVLVTK